MKNPFAKLFVAVLFFSAFSFHAAAQENCELASKQVPLLLNLKIGMSPEQAQMVFGRALKIKVKKKGERTFFQNYIKEPAPAPLNGVRALYLRFFDGKLYQIEVFYEQRGNFNSLDETINRLSSQINLPVSDWKIEYDRAEILCGEISLITDYILNPRIELTDETIRAQIEKAREKK